MSNRWHYLEVMFEGNLQMLKAVQDELDKLCEQRGNNTDDSKEVKRMRGLAIRELERGLEYEQAQLGRFIWNLYKADVRKAEIQEDDFKASYPVEAPR